MHQTIFPQQQANASRIDDRPLANSNRLTYALGFWSALVATVMGVLYSLVIVGALVTGQMTFPPPDWLQLFGGIISILFCPVLMIIMASLHTITATEKKGLSQISLTFTILFAIAVSINRFLQLGVIRQSVALGQTDGIGWFLAYGEQSIMFALEIMGWGWFLGLAMIFAAPLFAAEGYQYWLKGLLLLYGILALISAFAHLLASPLVSLGFVAWGPVLFLITALLAVYFRRAGLTERQTR